MVAVTGSSRLAPLGESPHDVLHRDDADHAVGITSKDRESRVVVLAIGGKEVPKAGALLNPYDLCPGRHELAHLAVAGVEDTPEDRRVTGRHDSLGLADVDEHAELTPRNGRDAGGTTSHEMQQHPRQQCEHRNEPFLRGHDDLDGPGHEQGPGDRMLGSEGLGRDLAKGHDERRHHHCSDEDAQPTVSQDFAGQALGQDGGQDDEGVLGQQNGGKEPLLPLEHATRRSGLGVPLLRQVADPKLVDVKKGGFRAAEKGNNQDTAQDGNQYEPNIRLHPACPPSTCARQTLPRARSDRPVAPDLGRGRDRRLPCLASMTLLQERGAGTGTQRSDANPIPCVSTPQRPQRTSYR